MTDTIKITNADGEVCIFPASSAIVETTKKGDDEFVLSIKIISSCAYYSISGTRATIDAIVTSISSKMVGADTITNIEI